MKLAYDPDKHYVIASLMDESIKSFRIQDHKAELEFLFNTFPDFSINEHTIGFGQGNWTAGLSISTGTFLNPMELPDGTIIEPTGEFFEVRIVTLANWEDGRIVEEYLIWDNEDWMRQIGVE